MERSVIDTPTRPRPDPVNGYSTIKRDKEMTTLALVDDDENIVASLKLFFEAEGYDVRTYHDGETALPALTETPPDIAILDVKMPRMDGMELLRRLDRKSTRLNSSHDQISYAVFCLKKKKHKKTRSLAPTTNQHCVS